MSRWEDLTTFDRSLYSMRHFKQVFTEKEECSRIIQISRRRLQEQNVGVGPIK